VSTGAVLSQVLHRRHPSQLGRQRALQAVLTHPAADAPHHLSENTPHLKWRERVSTGAVLSQSLHRRHQAQLGGHRSLQAVRTHVAADPTHHLSGDTLHISSGGSACQRVPCSHNSVSAVIRPSSVGIVPVNPRLNKLLPAHPLSSPNTRIPGEWNPPAIHASLRRSYLF
jgi:hypothetical protein